MEGFIAFYGVLALVLTAFGVTFLIVEGIIRLVKSVRQRHSHGSEIVYLQERVQRLEAKVFPPVATVSQYLGWSAGGFGDTQDWNWSSPTSVRRKTTRKSTRKVTRKKKRV